MSPQIAALFVVVILMGAGWCVREAVRACLRAGMAMSCWNNPLLPTVRDAKRAAAKWPTTATLYQAAAIAAAFTAGAIWERFL